MAVCATTSLACNSELEVVFIRYFNAVSATSPACNSEPEVVFIWCFDAVRATLDDVSVPTTWHTTTQREHNQPLPHQYHRQHQRKCAQGPGRVVPKLINASQMRTPVPHRVVNPILCCCIVDALDSTLDKGRRIARPPILTSQYCMAVSIDTCFAVVRCFGG